MARNKLAGTKRGSGRTTEHYRRNEKSRAKKDAKSKEINQRPEQVAKRVALNRKRRALKKAGKIRADQDLSHTTSGKLVKEDFRKNRARNRGRKSA